jgi:DsbC/DsbD-like thiol-disulfide interchange protein
MDYVYAGPTVLPVDLDLARGGSVSVDIFLGICDEICVPVNINILFPIDFSMPDRQQDLRLRQALADVPVLWEGDAAPVGEVRFEAENRRIAVEIDPTRVDPDSLIVDNGDPALLFGAPQKSPEPGLFYLKLLERGQSRDLHGEALRLTFLTVDGAFEVNRTVQ